MSSPLEPEFGDPPESDELVGQVLGETYRIVRVIGEGGTGRVYEAHHTRIGSKRFAVKVLHAEFLRHPEAWVRFQREAEAAGSIDHPNVVDVYDVDRTEDGRPYVVFEYLEGIELGALLEQRRTLPPKLAAFIAQQICAGLSAAHDKGVIHRDIKPPNIWLVGDPKAPEVKVLDFGLSRLRDDEATALTKDGTVLGTPAFMSPEQARGERVDTATDVYGVGTILYTTLTGRAPFVAETVQQILIAVMKDEPKRPRTIVPILPEALELVIQRAMAKRPEDRYPSVDALSDALDSFVEQTAPSVRPPPLSQPPGDSSSRSLLVLFMALALALAFVLVTTVAVGAAHVIAGPQALTDRELVLVLLAVVSTALTPAILWVRRLKRTIWGNSVKVQEELKRLRRITLAAGAAYGVAALVVRALDTVAGRFSESTLFSAAGGSAWVPFNLVFALVALVAATAAWFQGPRRFGERLPSWLAPALGSAIAAAVLYQGLRARASEVVVAEVAPLLTQTEGIRAEDAERLLAAFARAKEDELAAAVAHGTEALEKLRQRYPRDPAVLQALALAQARTSHREAVAVLAQLFAQAPEYAQDRTLRVLVTKAAQSSESREEALALMLTGMGESGLDLLYELMVSHKSLRPKIETMLASPEMRERFSPALAIAYELRQASDCASRVPLLERAARLGDERTIAVLAPLSEGTKSGCGAWKRNPCKPPCADQAKEFSAVVRKIQDRLRQ